MQQLGKADRNLPASVIVHPNAPAESNPFAQHSRHVARLVGEVLYPSVVLLRELLGRPSLALGPARSALAWSLTPEQVAREKVVANQILIQGLFSLLI